MLIAIGGRPGAGKTTLSLLLKRRLSCNLVSRDSVFRKLFEHPNPHSVEHKILAFNECLRLAELHLPGETVILDLPFSRNNEIETVNNLAKKIKDKLRFIYLECSERVANSRIKKQYDHLVAPDLRINTRTEALPKNIPILRINSSGPIKNWGAKAVEYVTLQ